MTGEKLKISPDETKGSLYNIDHMVDKLTLLSEASCMLPSAAILPIEEKKLLKSLATCSGSLLQIFTIDFTLDGM